MDKAKDNLLHKFLKGRLLVKEPLIRVRDSEGRTLEGDEEIWRELNDKCRCFHSGG